MLHEYALDPEVISNWQSFRYFVDSFGVSEGRLISQFPKHWKRMVYESVGRNRPTEIERARIEERLRRIDDRLLKQSRAYNGEVNWANNAFEQHQTKPFHAIITTQNNPGIEGILVADETDKDNQLWNISTQRRIPRVATDLAQAVSSLLKIAEHIIFIDPYFDPDKLRFRRPLEQFLQEALHQHSVVKKIDYHVKVEFENETERNNLKHNFDSSCLNKIAPIVPNGVQITFSRWKERAGGKRFHARYILTERGGVLIENGLDDDNNDGGQVTPIVLLNFDVYSEVWNDFLRLPDLTQCTYEYDDEITISGTKI